MTETNQLYNEGFYADKAAVRKTKKVTIADTLGVLAIYTALMYDAASEEYIKADETDTPADANTTGWCVLLEEVDTGTGDAVEGLVGVSGGIDDDDIVLAGANTTALNEHVKVILAMNNIFVNTKSNSITNV